MSVRLIAHLVATVVLTVAFSRGAERADRETVPTSPWSRKKAPAIQLWSGFDVVRAKGLINAQFNQYRLGMAAPISADGYCLTAGHVVESEPVGTMQLRSAPWSPLSFERVDHTGMIHFFKGNADVVHRAEPSALKLTGARVVCHFENADLAIVKVEFPTPNYFRTVAIPAPSERFVVRTNSYNRTPSSWVMTADQAYQPAKLDASGQFWTGELSIPGREGDSGSPVTGSSGRLHGVLIEKYDPPKWWPFANRRQTIVRYQGVSGLVLNRIMAIDRAQQRISLERRPRR